MDATTPGLTPWQRYQRDLSHRGFQPDPAQAQLARHTDALYHRLLQPESWLSRLQCRLSGRPFRPVRGLYVWGGVGRGKTWLLDRLYECLPEGYRQRMHFHRFMQRVHRELKALPDTRDPLQVVARRLCEQAQVLCLDEFHVSDITDAMLLSGLLQAFFEQGGVLVTSSNEAPDELYRNGLQRERFLPAITLLKRHTQVVHMDADTDYRLRYLDSAEIYHHPLNAQARLMLEDNFSHLTPNAEAERDGYICINERDIPFVRCAEGVIWFVFPALCMEPRSAADFIELAQCFHTVLLADVPTLGDTENDPARRFIQLVDEFYDRNVKLIITATVPPEMLYTGKRLAQEFLRTHSRLQEMVSHDYLARPHRSES